MSGSDAIQSLIEAHERRIQALLDADTRVLAEVVSEELTYVSSTGTLMTRPEVFAAFEAGTMQIQRMECDAVSTRLYGDTGIVLYEADTRMRNGDQVIEGMTRSTTVYVRERGNWRMVAQHQSRLE